MNISKRHISYLKYTVAILITLLLVHQVHTAQNQKNIVDTFLEKNWSENLVWMILVVLLMPINWYLESLKWKTLMKPFIKISTLEAIKSVLVGVSLGVVTPARLGEYGGRVLMSPLDKSREVISSTFAGSIAQNLINVVIGMVMSYFFLKSIINEFFSTPYLFYAVVLFQIIAMIVTYFYLRKMVNKMSEWSIFEKWKKMLSNVATIYPNDSKLLTKVLMWSVMRYGIYFVQYLCILYYLGIDAEFWILGSHVAGVFMIQTLIPLPAFLSIPARGEIAIMVWQNIGILPIWALTATYVLWFLNLVIPSIIGVIILLISNKNKNNGQVLA